MSVVVAFETRQIGAVERGLRSLHAERDLLARHGLVSVELDRDLDELEELRDRMVCERDRLIPVSRPAPLELVRSSG